MVLAPWAPPAAGELIKVGPPGFEVESLSSWKGRTVRSIELSGNRHTKEHVIRREIRTEVGEPLDLDLLAHDLVRLENLSIFADVRVEAERRSGDGVALRFVFKESPTFIPFPAYTYTEENGFSVGAGVSGANIDGQAMRLAARAYFGGTTQYWVKFSWPWVWGANHQSIDAFVAQLDRTDVLRGFEEQSNEFTPKVGRYIGDHGRVAASFTFFRMRSDVPGITLSANNEDTLHRVGLSLGLDTRDSWGSPRKGWQNQLEVWKTGGFLGADGDFWTVTFDVRRWIPTARRQKLALAGLLSLQSGTYGEDVPVYMDYRIGGANSVRGHPVELGQQLFGKNQMLGTAEYSYTLSPLRRWDIWKLSFRLGFELTAFGDVGVVWSEPGELNMGRTRGGVGVGLRIIVPGSEMTRLDIGWSASGGFQFHFAPWSKPTAQRFRLR
jgi:outer membrane protein insertion porin family